MSAPRFHPFVRLLFCALGLVAVSVAMGFMLLLGSTLATAWTGRRPDEQLADIATRYALPLTLLSYPASLLWIAYCRTAFDRCSFASLGLRARRLLPNFVRGAVAGALAIGVLWSVLWLTGVISVVGMSPEAFEMGWGSIAAALVGYALVFLAVGFFEEVLFRGYALHNFNHWLGWKGAIAAQATIFALIHLGNVVGGTREAKLAAIGALPALVLIAVFFALSYRKTGSLWFPIGFHFAWNFCLGCIFSLPVSGLETFRLLDVQTNQTSWLSGGQFGAEGSWLLLPILGLLIYFINRAPDHPQATLDLALLERTESLSTPAPAIIEEEEETEEARESRYRTKFGTSQGFSADTLRELRDLQEQREQAAREAAEAARRAKVTASLIVAPAPDSAATTPPPVIEAPSPSLTKPVLTPESPAVAEEPAPVAVAPETAPESVVAPSVPVVEAAPCTPTVTPSPAPPVPTPAPTEKKRPPSPRW